MFATDLNQNWSIIDIQIVTIYGKLFDGFSKGFVILVIMVLGNDTFNPISQKKYAK